jgi:hypothetical protein
MRRLFIALHESAFGTKRTSRYAQPMSAFGGKADIVPSCSQRDEGAADPGEYRQPEFFLVWCLTRLDGAGPDTPWYCGLGPHESLFPLRAAKHC